MRLEFSVMDVDSLIPEEKVLGEMLRYVSEEKVLEEFKQRLREEREKMLGRLREQRDQPFLDSFRQQIDREES